MKSFLSLVFLLFCGMVFGEVTVFRQAGKIAISVQSTHEIGFALEKMPAAGHALLLEFDARLYLPEGFGGYNAKGFLVYVNGKLVPPEAYLNCPMEFRFINGHTGEPGRWCPPKVSFNSIKTGNWHEDNVLKNGGNYFSLVYASNFEEIDTPKNKYSSQECSRSHFVFDITPCCQAGENTLVLYNAMSPAAVKAMGGSLTDPNNKKGTFPLVVRSLLIHEAEKAPVRQQPFWLEELAEISREMPVIEPRRDFTENYSVRFGQAGAVIVNSGEKEYRVNSYFSYPGECQFNRIPEGKGQEPGWVAQSDAKTMRFEGQGAFYKIHRELERFPGYFEIQDTLENTTEDIVPVMVRYEVPFTLKPGENCIYNSGLRVTQPIIDYTYFPENPTLFLQADQGGLGLVPGDDVLRIHAKNYTVPGAVQLRDEQLMLAPGKKLTLKLQVYPVEKGDYFTFLNQVRQVWNLNGVTIHGTYKSAIAMPKPGWKPNAGLTAIQVQNRYQGNWYWGLALAEKKELHEEVRKIIAAHKQIVPKEIRVFANYMAIYFSNATGEDLERFGDCVVVNKNGSYPMEAKCRFFIPTRTNEFGKMVARTVDMMINEWKADGIYFDYLEGADPYFTYNQTDGVSCDIDPKTGTLLAQKGSYQLLSQEFLIWLMRHVHEKGVGIHANRNPFTWTTATSLKEETPFRLTECGYPDQLTRGQLGFCPLGLQRTFSNNLHIQLLRALYEGMLTMPYDVRYQWDDNPIAFCYPFCFRELRRGCAIGDNKIITAISGTFGWGDGGGFKCRIFDSTGKLRDDNGGRMVVIDGKNYLKLQLQPMEVAVIDRIKK
ncbi:MAG: hypothetical protein IKP00_09420 [Victivallales bacterium]|nr:hypothetical protein [Victivallales bacterium]